MNVNLLRCGHIPENFLPRNQPQSKNSFFPQTISTIAHVAANWHEHTIQLLDKCEQRLEKFMPNAQWQTEFDEYCAEEGLSEDLKEANEWIDSNGDGDWYEQICICVAKLPLRAARNVVGLLSSLMGLLVKWPVYATVHPLKAPIELAKKFFDLIHALIQPETWSKIGAGTMGTALSMALAAGSPLSAITMGIAGAMVVGGVTVGTLKAALTAYRKERLKTAGHHLLSEAAILPEMMLTGLCTGAIIGGIQRIVRSIKHNNIVTKQLRSMSQDQAAEYVRSNGYPEGYTLHYIQGKIRISWNLDAHPELRYEPSFAIEAVPHYGAVGLPDGGAVVYVRSIEIVARQRIDLVGWVTPPKPPIPGQAFWAKANPVIATAQERLKAKF